MAEDPQQETINLLTYRLNAVSTELAAVTEQLKAAQDGWHDEITKGLSELRRAESLYTKAQERAERAEEQRDRLAEAIRKYTGGCYPESFLLKTLRSLNPK